MLTEHDEIGKAATIADTSRKIMGSDEVPLAIHVGAAGIVMREDARCDMKAVETEEPAEYSAYEYQRAGEVIDESAGTNGLH